MAGAHLHADEGLAFPERKTLEAIGVGPDCGGQHPFWKLAEMNDKGKSFAEIADYIEQRF